MPEYQQRRNTLLLLLVGKLGPLESDAVRQDLRVSCSIRFIAVPRKPQEPPRPLSRLRDRGCSVVRDTVWSHP